MVNLEAHQSWAASGLQTSTFSTTDSFTVSADSSADHSGDDCLHEVQSSLSEPREDLHKLEESFVCVSHNDVEGAEAVWSQESEQSVIPGDATLDLTQLGSEQLHGAGIVSASHASNDSSCSLPVLVSEAHSDQVVHNPGHQTLNLNSGYVNTDFMRLISNSHVFRPPEDPSPILSLDSPTLTVSASVPDSGRRHLDLPRIVKHKPSSITFSHYTCPSVTDGHAFVNESSDDGESSLDDEEEEGHHDDGDDDDDDDVFPELPQSREYPAKHRQRSTGQDKQRRRGALSVRAEINHTARSCGYEAEGETSSKEESPWSQSMSQLMRKLDQLHLDIEEALSANSSPSDTPCTARRKQWGAVSKSTLNRALKDQVLQRPNRGECPSQDGSSAPRSASTGTTATTKKTMFNKMTSAAGAGKNFLFFHQLFHTLCLNTVTSHKNEPVFISASNSGRVQSKMQTASLGCGSLSFCSVPEI